MRFGKTLFAYLAVKLRMAKLPDGVSSRHIYGVGLLGRIGFTISLFIARLTFGDSPLLINLKLGILLAALAAGVWVWLFLRLVRSSSSNG